MTNDEHGKRAKASERAKLRLLETFPPGSRGLQRRPIPVAEPQTTQCGSIGSFMRVATGKISREDAERLLSHAAMCEECGELLSRCMATLEGNPSAEEAAAIAEMAARKEWERGLAKQLAATSARRTPGKLSSRTAAGRWLAVGSAVAAMLAGVAALFVWHARTSDPEHMLASAYTEARTLELRIPEAGYADLSTGMHTRGGTTAHEPAPLLDARARLARNLERTPADAHWLELQARADLLSEHYDSAASVLDRLIATGPVTAELLTDAAAAYYQRGLVTGSELDRSTALDYLRRADGLAPTDPVVLFNEAILMEDRGQMMNAVEVWNRYMTVERDKRWAAEGKRKLEALEQTLNRLKTHQGRLMKMLGAPETMDALARNPERLAALDEELSSIELDKLAPVAFPAEARGNGLGQARGSPCGSACLAARRLLKALSVSLEIHHHDFWLSDLLSPDISTLSPAVAEKYARAFRLLAQATREDQTGVPATGAQLAEQARGLFQQLKTVAGTAARAGDERAAVEYMFALQRSHDFSGCRSFAERLRAQPSMRGAMDRYPWIEAVDELTEKVCDDTPEGRIAGRKLQEGALHLAEANGYDLLGSRIHMRMVDDAQDARDLAMAEHLTLTTLRKLEDADAPTIRIIDAVATMSEIENDTPRKHTGELYLRETLDWQALIGSHARKALLLTELARAQTRMDAMKDAERSLRLAQQEADASGMKGVQSNLLRESEIFLAQAMLERGDLSRAARYLDLASSSIDSFSDIWALRTYAGARGQLALARGDLKGAAYALEQQIHSSEGENVHTGDRTSRAEYGEQDHDLYAELAATWLAQGRSPESVLALWERFRMRARGLPITQCAQGTWDCEQLRLVEAQHRLGSSVLIGQIVLLDRVLLYRADRYGVTWTVKPMRRQELLDAAQALETAASSPLTTTEVAEQLGASLSLHLLPALPSAQQMGNTILLEADPMLANLAWPVLPTPAGPLGLTYPVAEVRSILAETSGLAEPSTVARAVSMDRGTSRRAVALSYKLGNSSEGGRALVIGASVADGDMAPLPEAMAEATAVSRYEHAPDLLLGEQATTAHVAAAIGSATLLHFAGHAVQDGNGTQLLLAAASPTEKTPWIDGAFLLKHPPRVCKLAVLSACATGKREASWNRPLQDIVETLRSLGVPEVVATRWQIDSGAAVPFMKAFYGSVAAGNTVAVALTAARKLQSAQSHDNHPYYWAAYYVTGQETTHLGGELHASF